MKAIGEPTVRVSTLAIKGGYGLGAVGAFSLALWLIGWGGFLLNPVASIISLVAAPALIWMGRRLRGSGRI